MNLRIGARRGFVAASWAFLLGSLLAACAPRTEAPAPVVGGQGAERGSEWVTVQRGDSLSDIAHAHHIPMRLLAEANGLLPPYRIQVGRRLMIPETGQTGARPPAAVAAVPPAGQQVATGAAARLDDPGPSPLGKPPPQAAPLPPVISQGTEAANRAGIASAPASAPAPPQGAPAPPAAASAEPPPAHTGSAFLWPVRGRVLASYGTGPDGTHNDGINIGAPRGTAVEAIDAGVVAYTGNELRGYGNLILIKHANGWISAYAHCDQLLVRRGEKVTRGQVIARVGSTGNVSEPQLHFELRRGHQPVDPREFLTPLPTAVTQQPHSG